MSIRINKIIGYGNYIGELGLTKEDIDILKDPPNIKLDIDQRDDMFWKISGIKGKIQSYKLFSVISYDTFEDDELIVFIPPYRDCENWYRRDDIIDYYEVGDSEERIKFLDEIHPYKETPYAVGEVTKKLFGRNLIKNLKPVTATWWS